MKCNCEDWKINIPKVDAPRLYAAARNPGSFNYDGVRFRFCPWCGGKLIAETVHEIIKGK